MFDIKYEKLLWRAAAVVLAAELFAAAPVHAQDKSSVGPTSIPVSAQRSKAPWPLAPDADPANVSAEPASGEARQIVGWVIATGDNHGMPFVIVDKKDTKVFAFDGGGRLLGETSALLGLARGDDSAPGVGDKKLSDIRPDERTTPAGRFVASLGYGLGKQDILWVDYASALALHRVLPANSNERRLQRIASTSPLDHRITFGCINVSTAFYDEVIHPLFVKTSGVVYILPEIKPISAVFPLYA